jgi:hypothetical protein
VFASVTLGATKINVSFEKAVGSTLMYPTLTILLHIALVLNPVPFIVTYVPPVNGPSYGEIDKILGCS